MSVLHACMYVTCGPIAPRDQKKALSSLELEFEWLWVAVEMLGTGPFVPCKSNSSSIIEHLLRLVKMD